MKKGVLKRGDLIFLDFSPQAGREMKDRHPAFVVSPFVYNKTSSLIVCCPITSTIRKGPWEVELPYGLAVRGAILTNQIKSLDVKARGYRFEDTASQDIIDEVIARIQTLVT
jgi:mRNA interferase MazF